MFLLCFSMLAFINCGQTEAPRELAGLIRPSSLCQYLFLFLYFPTALLRFATQLNWSESPRRYISLPYLSGKVLVYQSTMARSTQQGTPWLLSAIIGAVRASASLNSHLEFVASTRKGCSVVDAVCVSPRREEQILLEMVPGRCLRIATVTSSTALNCFVRNMFRHVNRISS